MTMRSGAQVKHAKKPIGEKFATEGVRIGRDGLTLGERVEAALAAEVAVKRGGEVIYSPPCILPY